jgi:FixJ family two-component response regulator/signal transduction histidine kinase
MPDPGPGPVAVHASETPEFERLLADLSAGFVNLPPARIDAAITDALRRSAASLGADRAQLIRFSDDGRGVAITHSGALDGVPAAQPLVVTGAYPWVVGRLRAGEPAVIPRLDDLPPEAALDRARFERIGVKSNLTMPMTVAGKVVGALAFGCMRAARDWPPRLVERVGVLATIFGNALAHKRAQEGLDAAITFERLISDVLGRLLTARPGEVDQVIEAGLADMAQAFGAGRATLWQRVGDRPEFVKTHRWLADGVPVARDVLGPVGMPWIGARLAAGETVRFVDHSNLPPAAAADLPRLRELDIRSAMMVPLAVSGQVVGALSFATPREDREWPAELVSRTRLFGEVLASALARQAAERREQDAQAQAAHAARVGTMGVIAASLVHELTQPLAASLANAQTAVELLDVATPDLDELRATVADIVADDRRVGDLIRQLRRFLRRGEVERTEVDMREVVGEVLRLAGNAATEKGAAITLDLAESLPRLAGDRVQLEQVLLNLLLNAIDAVAANEPGARRITVVARASETGIGLEVSDTGPGMDEQTLARVFQPFFTTKPGGMGLGLSISRSIVAAHGGSLSARSAPGSGTTFRVQLPLRPPAEAPAEPASPAVAAPSAGTVFLIDDDASMRRALERQLEDAGCRVEAFASAQDYLDRAPQGGIACIVSDVRMPGLSGLDLQASLARAGRGLPMVFMSGHGDVPTAAHAMKAGAVAFLAKPFSKAELLAAVGDALGRAAELDAGRRERAALRDRYDSLTPREREVFALVAAGLLNKLIADRLGAAEGTIKIHRGRMMEKMGAASVVDLARMAERLGVEPANARAPD